MPQTIHDAAAWLSLFCISVSAIGCAYALFAGFQVRYFTNYSANHATRTEPVTILKPLSGDEPGLYANLSSFCAQNYGGPLQIVFGVQDAKDPAIAVARRVMADFPDLEFKLVIDSHLHGSNRKVSNLINMAQSIRHGIVVLADSDMQVQPGYLGTIVDALRRQDIGLVTCLYRGAANGGIWSRLSAMAIDDHFLPGVLVGLTTGLASPCFGSTIALRRETLREIGGFEAFADKLADDYAMGEAVRRTGLKVAIPPLLVAHACPQGSFADLWHQELRWARTISAVNFAGFSGSGLTHATSFAVLGAASGGFGTMACAMIGLAFASRLWLQMQVAREFDLPMPHFWLNPLRDALSLAVYLACFFTSRVEWRGRSFQVADDGSISPVASS